MGVEPEPSLATAAALAGIYAYASGYRPGAGPDSGTKLQVIDIVEAARILAGAPSPAADTARRRAIGVLATAGTPPGLAGSPWQPLEVDAALQAIGAPMRELAEEFLRAGARASGAGERVVDPQWVAYQVLGRTAGPWQQRCCSCLTAWDVASEGPDDDGVAKAYFKVSVPRSRLDVRGLMDPQSWAACSPDFFNSTWVIETGANAQCELAPLCTVDTPTRDPSPPNPSSVWKGTLFEHYHNAYIPGGAACANLPGTHGAMYVRNVLRVAKTRGGGVDTIDYGLCRPQADMPALGAIDSAIDCNCEQHGVDVDCGQTRTFEREPGNAWVEGFKRLKFSRRAIDYDLDRWAAIGLRMMIDEIVEDGVCCSYPKGPVGEQGQDACPSCPEPLHLQGVQPPPMPLCGP